MAARSARPQSARQHGWAMALCAFVAAVSFALGGGIRPAAAQFTDTNPPWVGIPPVPKVPTGRVKPMRLEGSLSEQETHPTGVVMGFGTVH